MNYKKAPNFYFMDLKFLCYIIEFLNLSKQTIFWNHFLINKSFLLERVKLENNNHLFINFLIS
jgi:hypothetical protein